MTKYTVANIAIDANGDWAADIVFPPDITGKGRPRWVRLFSSSLEGIIDILNSRLKDYKDYYVKGLTGRKDD